MRSILSRTSDIISILSSMPQLRSLSIGITSNKIISNIIKALPLLTQLNGKTITSEDKKNAKFQNISNVIEEQEYEELFPLILNISSESKDFNIRHEEIIACLSSLGIDFEFGREEIKHLESLIKFSKIHKIRSAIILLKQYLCFLSLKKIVTECITHSDPKISTAIKDLQDMHEEAILELNEEIQKAQANANITHVIKDTIALHTYNEQISDKNNRIVELENENAKLLEVIKSHVSKSSKSIHENSLTLSPSAPLFKQQLDIIEGIMPIKQFKEFIANIYVQKAEFNAQCRKENRMVETMEAYVYSFLKHRYGLKDVYERRYDQIIGSIANYFQKDVDVAVFAKIIRNEIDESYANIHYKFRKIIKEIFDSHFKFINKNKGQQDLEHSMKMVSIIECGEICKKIYSKDQLPFVLKEINKKVTPFGSMLNIVDISDVYI